MIIGFGHRKQVGKDTCVGMLGDYLYHGYGKTWRSRSFADPLYKVCEELYGWLGFKSRRYYNMNPREKEVKLPDINMTPREILIAVGTSGIREGVWAATWVNLLVKAPHDEDFTLVPDVRFPNEADAIKEAGGVLIKVVRPSVEPTDDKADNALDDYAGWDTILVNSGSLEDLEKQMKGIASEVLHS